MEVRKSDLTSQLAEKDFAFFYRVVLRMKLAPMHEEIIDAIMNDPRHLVVMASRGHGKTQLLSIAFPLWIAFRTPERKPQEIAILSASLEQSTKILRHIKRLISSNPVLRERLMPEKLHDVKWSETQVELKNGHLIMCFPFGDSIRGTHVNYCISDDVLTDETTNVVEAKNIFFGPVFPIVQAKNGKHIVVGTPMSYTDLLHELSSKSGFKSLHYPALKSDGTPQFPEKFNLAKLQRIRDAMPSIKWAREYMISPVTDSSALFPFETLLKPCIDLDYGSVSDEQMRQATYVIGGDVAVSEKERGDFSCYTVLQLVEGRPWRVFQKHHFKGKGTGEQGAFVVGLQRQLQFAKIVVEQTGLSFGVVDYLMHDDATKFNTEGFNTTQKSKSEILGLLETWLRNKQLKLQDDQSMIDELMGWTIVEKDGKQVPQSTKAHDDQVMSLALAVYAASTVSGKGGALGVEKPVFEHGARKQINTLSVADVIVVNHNDDVLIPLHGPFPVNEPQPWVG